MREKSAKPDVLVSKVAKRQHGVVATRQLLDAGLGKDGISRRVDAGRLHRLWQGVYAVGHAALSHESRFMAAVLACGHAPRGGTVLDCWGASVSYRSAAELWELLPGREGPVDVSVPGSGGKKRRRGIRLHRSLILQPADVTLRNGIPVTTPARTAADLRRVVSRDAGIISERELRRAIRQADVLGLLIGEEPGRDRTRSELEQDFLRLCRRHHLPEPEVNARVGRHLVDFLWRERCLIVETDGYRYHRGLAAFEDDRDRNLGLRALGYEVLRLSGRLVSDEPDRVAAVLRDTLGLSR